MLYLVGALRYVPVAALYDPVAHRHLIEQYALAVYTVGGLRDNRVARSGYPLPAPTERSVPISGTTLVSR
jgi:CHAT domain-containing protein